MKLRVIAAIGALLLWAPLAQAATIKSGVIKSGVINSGSFSTIVFSVSAISNTYFDVTSNGSTFVDGGIADTDIAIYAGTGANAKLVASDSNNGIGESGLLSFGIGSGLALGDKGNGGNKFNANGANGAMLATGVYTLVIGDSNIKFGNTLGATSVKSTPPKKVAPPINYNIDFVAVIPPTFFAVPPVIVPTPLPAGLSLMAGALASFGVMRHRKKKRAA
jgi:hypothetical protein